MAGELKMNPRPNKKAAFFGSLFGLAAIFAPQDIVKNPDKPANPKSGRILNLREELRITDEGGPFFLEFPRRLKTGPEGSIYIYDHDQLIQLDARGHFVRNYYKKGQGPGELNAVSNFDFVDRLLLVHSNNPGKLVWFDGQGQPVREVSLSGMGGRMDFVFLKGETLYFFKMGRLEPNEKAMPVDLPHSLLAVSSEGKERGELTVFPTRALAIGGAMMWEDLMSVVMDGRFVFVSHSNSYSIKVFDCQTRRVLREFYRPYQRVPRPKGSRGAAIFSADGTKYELPGSGFLRDIAAMFVVQDTLWIQTSTKDPEKGYLFDVFDLGGRYLDMFFLKKDGRLLAVEGDALYIVETTSEGTAEVVKYRVAESSANQAIR